MKFTFAPEATPLAGYTIKRAIDRGGFGEVYYALSDSGKEVALKLLQRNQQVELRGVSQCLNLKHPNLVTIYDIKTDEDGDHWVVMEYVSGKSLEAILEEHPGGLPLPEVEEWLAGMAAGTAFLHDRGIVHRDLKPANVFRENGVVKIGDVGLSKFITPSRRSAQTESVGTVYYMAPEVARGKYGSELDVYSLGVILYEMITGHVPFAGESTGEILMKHLTEPPDLTKLPASLRSVVGRALEKDPQRRTPGAIRVLEEFRRARQGKQIAEEIPESHFVDVPRLERNATWKPAVAAGDRLARNGNAETAHYAGLQNGAGRPVVQQPVPANGEEPLERVIGRKVRSFADEIGRKPWLAIVILVVAFALIREGRALLPGAALPRLFVLAGISLLAFGVVKRAVGTTSSRPCAAPAPPIVPAAVPRESPAPVAVIQPVVQPVERKPAAPPPRGPQRLPTPDTCREITLRKRLTDLTGSMTMAVFWSAVATGLASLVAQRLPMPQLSSLIASPAGLGLFGLTTVIGSWTVLLASKFWEGSGLVGRQRRLMQTALGAAVGACAWWLHHTLLVDLGYHNSFSGIFQSVGGFDLLTNSPTSSSMQPALPAYVLYFAVLFGIRRWWWMVDALRPKRFRIGSVLLTAFVAFVIPAAFAFHQDWGLLWGTAIASVVQLSAPWVAAKNRAALVQAPAGGAATKSC